MLLEMKGITKFFGPVKALDNVDFTVAIRKFMACWAKMAPASLR
jgi:ABC-type sugar transport system ATPase subunit